MYILDIHVHMRVYAYANWWYSIHAKPIDNILTCSCNLTYTYSFIEILYAAKGSYYIMYAYLYL